MPNYFFDSSALVKRYRSEAGSQSVNDLLDAATRIFAARLTQVEVTAALVRRSVAANLSPQTLQLTLSVFDRDLVQSFEIVELELPVFQLGIELTRKHRLRAADALQLACALFAADEIPNRALTVVGSDLELNAAALAEGLTVIDPTQP